MGSRYSVAGGFGFAGMDVLGAFPGRVVAYHHVGDCGAGVGNPWPIFMGPGSFSNTLECSGQPIEVKTEDSGCSSRHGSKKP